MAPDHAAAAPRPLLCLHTLLATPTHPPRTGGDGPTTKLSSLVQLRRRNRTPRLRARGGADRLAHDPGGRRARRGPGLPGPKPAAPAGPEDQPGPGLPGRKRGYRPRYRLWPLRRVLAVSR